MQPAAPRNNLRLGPGGANRLFSAAAADGGLREAVWVGGSGDGPPAMAAASVTLADGGGRVRWHGDGGGRVSWSAAAGATDDARCPAADGMLAVAVDGADAGPYTASLRLRVAGVAGVLRLPLGQFYPPAAVAGARSGAVGSGAAWLSA